MISPYTVTIENEDSLSDRSIIIENEDGVRIESWNREEEIDIHYGAYDTIFYLTKESFLDLYETMTALKSYIDADKKEKI